MVNLNVSAAAGHRPLKDCTPKYFAILLMINRRHRDLGHLTHETDLYVNPRQHRQDGQGKESIQDCNARLGEQDRCLLQTFICGQHAGKPNCGASPLYSGRCIPTALGYDSTRATSLPGALVDAAIMRYGNPQSLSRRLIALSRSCACARSLQKASPFAIALDCRSRPRPTPTGAAMLGVLAGDT